MNLKRMISLALMALLLCMLPVWAMAAEMEIEGRVVINSETLLDAMGNDELLELVVTKANSTIVFDGVNISDGEILIHCPENANVESVKIELIGDNSISTDEYDTALLSELPLTIAGEGSLTCTSSNYIAIGCWDSLTMQSGKLTAKGAEGGIVVEGLNFSFLGDELTVEVGDDYGGIAYAVPNGEGYKLTNSFTLPEYSSTPAGYTFKAWSVNGVEMQPGDTVDTAGGARVSVKPVFERIPELPTTGDDSNVILWSALVFVSVIGMTMLVRKRKEA